MRLTYIKSDGTYKALGISKREAFELISSLTGHLAGVGGGACPAFTCTDANGERFHLSIVLEPESVPVPPRARDTDLTEALEETQSGRALGPERPKPKVSKVRKRQHWSDFPIQ
jgi:hypothetical protein